MIYMNKIYGYLLHLIEKGAYEYEDMQNKLDLFFLVGRITDEEYRLLTEKITPHETEIEAEEEGGDLIDSEGNS